MLNLQVKSDPLQHLTKTRIRNNSRKVTLPSKKHLKRNLISGSFQFYQTFDSLSMETTLDEQRLPLKLPPPPVAKKPKITPKSSMPEISPDSRSTQTGMKMNQQKPAIAPKPVIQLEPKKLSDKPAINKMKEEINDLIPKLNNNGSLLNESKAKEIGSPTKTSMSFSERLKASSLSRRKEANNPESSSGKFRSEIISPIRRGSRNFLTLDSAMNNELKNKPRDSIFKRYSSETSLKFEEAQEDFDLDQLKNLSIDAVDPVIVDSVLSPNTSFEEDDAVKDSFDSSELFKWRNEALSTEKGNEIYHEFDSSQIISANPAKEKSSDHHDETSESMKSRTKIIDPKEQTMSMSYQDEMGSGGKAEKTSIIGKLNDFDHKNIARFTAVQNSHMPESNYKQNKDLENEKEFVKMNVKEEPISPRKFGTGLKDGIVNRRKFKPIEKSEVDVFLGNNLISSDDKIHQDTMFGLKGVDGIDLTVSVDTDSSLEHVTQDIELDSTFEVPVSAKMNHLSTENFQIKQNEKVQFAEDNNIVFVPDLSSSPPLDIKGDNREQNLENGLFQV